MDIDVQHTEWMKDAYCAGYPDPDLWHYESSTIIEESKLNQWRMAEAIRICGICPVREQCLEEGLKPENNLIFNQIEGTIWGGKLLGERLNIREGRITSKFKKEAHTLREVRKKIDILNQ